MDQGMWMGYNWTKPKSFYNQLRVNFNGFYSSLVSPLDELRGKDKMFQNATKNINANTQTKKLWWFGINITANTRYNDIYEPRVLGRVFSDKGGLSVGAFLESNFAKKFSWTGQALFGNGGIFNKKSADIRLSAKVRFNSKFSVELAVNMQNFNNQSGWADILHGSVPSQKDTVIFSCRDIRSVENILNIK
jgi:Domain of unknown function (DUF5916)